MGARRRKIVWSEGANREIEEAVAYVALHSPRAAARLLERILTAVDTLATLSERGRIVPERGDPRIRELQVDPYRLIYSVGESETLILAVLHQRRDIERWAKNRTEP